MLRIVSPSADLDLRIKNSRIGVSNWTYEASLPKADHRQIVRVCDTEMGLLEGLRGLSADQQMSVDLILHRWRDLRAHCLRNAPAASTPSRRRTPARASA